MSTDPAASTATLMHCPKERFYWPGYWKDVQLYCQACTCCATRKTLASKRRAPLQPIHAGHPLELVAMDLTGPFPEGPSGNCYLLIVGDYFTKWMEAYAMPDQEATTVAQKLAASSLSPIAYIQTKENSSSPNLSLLPASCYRLTSPGLPHTTHSLMHLLNGSIARWQICWRPLRRSTPLSGKGTCTRYVLHTIPVCMHQ